MKFEATCPHCGKRYRVDDEFLGRRGACKGCGSSFVFRPDTDGSLPEEYLEWFRAVKAELVARFGPADDLVHFSPVPLYVDPQHGLAESLQFRNYVPGLTYCTCPLSLYESDQQPNRDGYYELMMCGRRELPFAPSFIGGLATYTFERALTPATRLILVRISRPARTCGDCWHARRKSTSRSSNSMASPARSCCS